MDDEPKQIDITGKTSRYMIKKLTKKKELPKTRVSLNKWNISSDYFNIDKQLSVLTEDSCRTIKEEIEKKINSYKHQDILKKRYDENNIIDYHKTRQLILDCNLTCHYCKENVFILYEKVRDMNQWTLDRIDNDLGHIKNNVVISCLKCNLNRRRRSADKFLFTKQMVITRENISDSSTNEKE
jgi:hypothetical protein